MMLINRFSIIVVLLSRTFKESDGVFAFYERNSDTRYLETSSAVTVTSSTECCVRCQQNQNCRFANYHRDNKICEIGTGPSVKDAYLSSIAGWNLLTLKVTCAPGWTKHKTSCYMLSNKNQNWDDAQAECGSLHTGGHLADIHSVTIHHLLNVLYNHAAGPLHHFIWIGGRLDSANIFRWTDQSRVSDSFQYWVPGQPDFFQGNENCIHVQASNSYMWNDDGCNDESIAFCEY